MKVHYYINKSLVVFYNKIFFNIIQGNSLLHTCILPGLVRQCFLQNTVQQKVLKPNGISIMCKKVFK